MSSKVHSTEIKTIGDKIIAIHMHFFRDLYAELRASGVLSVTAKTLNWRHNEAREKSTQRGNQLLEQELDKGSKNVTL